MQLYNILFGNINEYRSHYRRDPLKPSQLSHLWNRLYKQAFNSCTIRYDGICNHRCRLITSSHGGGTELFDVTICHPLSQARIRDAVENQLNLLKAAWTAKVSRYESMHQTAGTRFNLLPVPLSTLGGWHPDPHKALCTVASTIAARRLSTFSRARRILFQRHAALLVTNSALCLMPGL